MIMFFLEYGVSLLAFFLPFERIGSYDVAGITIRPSQILAGIIFFCWVAHGIAQKRFRLVPNPIFFPLLLFWLVNLVGILFSPAPMRSFVIFLFICFTTSLAIFLPLLVRHEKILLRVVKGLFGASALVSVFGLYQFVGDYFLNLSASWTGLRDLYTKDILGFPRIQSTALEPLYFANFLFIPLCLCLTLFFSNQKYISKKILIPLLIVVCINFVLTIARGAYIALVPALFVLGCFYLRQIFRAKNMMWIFLIALLVFGGTVRFFGATNTWEKFSTHTRNIFVGASYAERVQTFFEARRLFEERPWLGSGPGSFGPSVAPHPLIQSENGWKIVNNEYLELLAENGVLGLLLFVIMMIIVLIRTLKAALRSQDPFVRALLLGFGAALVGILVQYNTFSVIYIMHIWFTVGMLLSLQNYVLRRHDIAP